MVWQMVLPCQTLTYHSPKYWPHTYTPTRMEVCQRKKKIVTIKVQHYCGYSSLDYLPANIHFNSVLVFVFSFLLQNKVSPLRKHYRTLCSNSLTLTIGRHCLLQLYGWRQKSIILSPVPFSGRTKSSLDSLALLYLSVWSLFLINQLR